MYYSQFSQPRNKAYAYKDPATVPDIKVLFIIIIIMAVFICL